jgi:hypothetical protein
LLTGSLRVDGSIESPAIKLTATLRDADLQLGEIALRGTLEVEASIRDLRVAPRGLVDLDATEAELGYAGFFTKTPGIPARVTGQVTTGAEGLLAIDTWEFVMQGLDGQVRVGSRDRSRLAYRGVRIGRPRGAKRPRPARRPKLGAIHLNSPQGWEPSGRYFSL